MPHFNISGNRAALVAVALLIAAPAQAQIGGLIKRATDKAVTNAVQPTQQGNLKPSDTFGTPLTETSLRDVLRGLAAEMTKVDRRDALEKQADSVQAKRSALMDKHDTERQVYEKQTNAVGECNSTAQHRFSEKHNAEMQAKATDPGFQTKMMVVMRDYATAQSKAQQSGDTAAATKATRDYQASLFKAMGVDMHADSLEMEKQCGKMPAEPAWMKEANALGNQEEDLRNQMRLADSQIISSGATASGMTLEHYGLARERVVNWYHEVAYNSPIQEFPAAERKVFEARKADIAKYKKVLS